MTHEGHLDQEKLVILMVTQLETEANIVKGLLEEAGIHCALLTPVPHNIYPFTVDGLATIQILVLESRLEAAREVLRAHESAQDWDTPDDAPGDAAPS